MKYIKGLDTLRFLAVFLVLIDKYHWGPLVSTNTKLGQFLQEIIPNGRFGVNLFFVISGFLISSILFNEKFNNSSDSNSSIMYKFYIRRALRIFPIYYLVLLFCLLLNNAFVQEHILYFGFYASNFLQNKPGNILLHTWSLAVEEQFYLLWPWLLIYMKEKHLKYVFFAFILTGLFFKYYEYYVLKSSGYLILSHLDSFGLGGLMAYAYLNEERKIRFRKGFYLVFLLIFFLEWRLAPMRGFPAVVIMGKFLGSLVSIALLLYLLDESKDRFREYIRENKIFNFLGKISYGIYLYHFILGVSIEQGLTSVFRATALSSLANYHLLILLLKIASIILISWLSFKFIEQPIISLKKRFTYAGA